MLYFVTALALAADLVLSWFLGSWMHLRAPGLWILRCGLALVGCIAAGAVIWFHRQAQTKSDETPPDQELDLLLKAADTRLKSGKLPHGSSIGTLPVAILIGLPGSAKTSILAHSGIDPELLAGAASGETTSGTPAVNVWYSGGTVFVEPSGNTLLDTGKWRALLRRIHPARLRSTLGGNPQAPRIALVCFNAEMLVADPRGAAAQAHTLRARLSELAQSLGVQLPVYVLFTRTDKIPYFTEYVSTLSREEADAVIGCTLPLEPVSPGLYSEHQSARVGKSFDDLFGSLAAARLDLLQRAKDEHETGCAYEFPREFRKLRSPVSEFLVELCRPSQFNVGPILRGYYFGGVRAVVVETRATSVVNPAPKVASRATLLFRTAALMETEAVIATSPQTRRRVPQWIFLNRLFREILLTDRAAMGASSISTHTNAARRILLVSAAAVSLMLAIAFTVSWVNNRALAAHALAAARGFSLDPMHAGTPSLDSLQRLDSLRGSLETIVAYRSAGAPLRYRWGLYAGNALYPELRRIYFDRFKTLLFAGTQARLVETLRSVPSKAGSDYGLIYDTLKAYLITTSNHEHSTQSFPAPLLLERWSNGRHVDAAKAALAARQFQFYTSQLKQENPFSNDNDAVAVARAREYLADFGGSERIYRAILSEASARYPAIDFNRQFPGSRAVTIETYQVSGAFSQAGWHFINDAIRNPAQYLSGEQWVLGNAVNANFNMVQIQNELHARYVGDFLNAWRSYLKSASLVRYGSIADASRKLDSLSGNRSPLLALLALASQNTAVDDPDVSSAFQAVQAVVPPASVERFIAPSNQNYMGALLALQSSLEQAASQPGEITDAASAPVLAAAASANVAARQVAQSFRPDPAGRIDLTVKKLLEDPITQVESLMQGIGPGQLNAKAKALCAEVSPLLAKYPFNRNASTEATIAEVNAVFRKPDGAFWTFYNANLQKLVSRQGGEYVAAPGAGLHVRAAFIAFMNKMADVSNALYSGGSDDPQFAYALTPEPAEGIQQLGLALDGQTLSYSGGAATPKQFTWKGSTSHQATASVRFGSSPDLVWSSSQGPWAIFHLFDKADQTQSLTPGSTILNWTIRIGKDAVALPNGKPLTVRLILSTASLPPFLNKAFQRPVCSSLAVE